MHPLTAGILEKAHHDYIQTGPATFNGLQKNLLLKIIRLLDVTTESSLKLTCKRFYVLAQENFMWDWKFFSEVFPGKEPLQLETRNDQKYRKQIQDEWIKFLKLKHNIDKVICKRSIVTPLPSYYFNISFNSEKMNGRALYIDSTKQYTEVWLFGYKKPLYHFEDSFIESADTKLWLEGGYLIHKTGDYLKLLNLQTGKITDILLYDATIYIGLKIRDSLCLAIFAHGLVFIDLVKGIRLESLYIANAEAAYWSENKIYIKARNYSGHEYCKILDFGPQDSTQGKF